jgi:PAS domain S-box-containing protein
VSPTSSSRDPFRATGPAGAEARDVRTAEAAGGREARLRTLVEQIPAVVFLRYQEDGLSEVYVSPALEARLGYSHREWLDDPLRFIDCLHPDDRRRWNADAAALLATGEPVHADYRVLARGGRTVWFHCEATFLRRPDGSPWLLHGVGFDITAVKEQQLKLAQAEERFRGLLECAPDPIVIVDETGAIVIANTASERVFGYSRGELLGQPVEMLVPARFRDRHAWHRQGFFPSAHFRPMGNGLELHGLRKNGTEFPVEVSLSVLRTGSEVLVLSAIRDISERLKAERERAALERAKAQAEAVAMAKTEFLANISHEIRTPMNGVVGMAHLLDGADLNDDQRELLDMLRGSAEAMLRVVNDILDFSQIEGGQVAVEQTPFTLTSLVAESVRTFGVQADARELALTAFVDPGLPEQIVGDAGRLRQVIVNLVGNAIKFTKRGDVRVLVTAAAPRDDGTPRVRIDVRDTGIGIPFDKQRLIFEAFRQADGSTTRSHGGTGLGLSISSRLADLMGGHLSVESEPGVGSCFTLVIPARPAADTVPLAERYRARLEGTRALVALAHPNERADVSALLAGCGVHVDSCERVPVTAGLIGSGTPWDVAVIDLRLRDEAGRNLLEAANGLPLPPVVLRTSLAEGSRIRPVPPVAAAVMMPLSPVGLLDAVAAAVARGFASTRQDRRSRIDELRVLVADDDAVNLKVVTGFLAKLGTVPTCATSGRQAAELAARETFDVILLDVEMPDGDGFWATAAIREGAAATRAICPYIIALTGRALSEDRAQCLAAGMDDYVSKPINPRDLYEALERASTHVPSLVP